MATGGPADGRALIHHSGTPSAGLLFEPLVTLGAERGWRHIADARPGYAGSSRHPGRAVADCAADVAAIADSLALDRFFTTGQSGGGPHALATAALLGDRVIAAATTGGAAPWNADGLDFLAGMGQENHDEFGAAVTGEAELRSWLEREAREMVTVTGSELHSSLGDLVSEVDRQALTGEFADHIAASFTASVRSGVDGWLDDDLALIRDWGFDLAAISVPVTIWQGGQDRFVPFAHGQWLADHLPGARPRLLPEHGHLSIELDLYGEILDDLLVVED
ncbi:MAG: alpha/beta hydrolase [Solirubrobacteraceae bacterium]